MTESGGGRRVALAGARAAGATIGVGIAVLAIALAGLVPLPTRSVTPASVRVIPVAVTQQSVCAGSFLRLGSAQGENASNATAVGAPSLAYGSSSKALAATALGGTGTPALLAAPPGNGAQPTLVSGSQIQAIAESDLTGLAAAGCSAPSSDSWLVGGSTVTGRTTLITLANPTDVPATVTLDLFGEAGIISAPGATGIVVDPQTQKVLSLAGFAPETASPVVHVTSTGGLVTANLQESIVRRLETAGADITGASANPATSVTIPGVVVLTPDDIENRIAVDASSGDLGPALRLFAPGGAAGTATVTIVPESASGPGAAIPIAIKAKTVTDVSLDGLDVGTYSIRVASTVPVVAAARVSAVAGPDPAPGSSDFTWIASPPAVAELTSFTVSPGPSAALHVANPSAVAVTATVTGADGVAVPLAVPAGASVSMPIAAGTFSLQADGVIRANVGYSSTSQLATFSIEPRLADADAIVIYP